MKKCEKHSFEVVPKKERKEKHKKLENLGGAVWECKHCEKLVISM